MGLTLDGKNYFSNNLVYVSDLSGISTNLIISDPQKNILAYASAFNIVMNSVASQKPAGTKISDIIFSTLVALSELPSADEGQIFALNTQLYSYFTFLNAPEFQEKYNLPFNLLADEDHSVSEAYGVWGEKKFMGRAYMGIIRTTFVIDEKGKIKRVINKVDNENHSEQLLG